METFTYHSSLLITFGFERYKIKIHLNVLHVCLKHHTLKKKVPTHELQKELYNLFSRKEESNLLYRT